ncbi:hypothetical protein Vch1786_I2051 [Vibrio cholerae O1 str. 2010EL-1786]|nr:hypothetical protein Vch1786_I2051 [Vibrio cholerae O1 str. 2010EL-1786]GHZ37484.1 hypothetical protein VCSRO124_2805 [Vibrio cholerae]
MKYWKERKLAKYLSLLILFIGYFSVLAYLSKYLV